MTKYEKIAATPTPLWMKDYIKQTDGPKMFSEIHAETDPKRPVHKVWRALDSAMRAGLLVCHCRERDKYFPVYTKPEYRMMQAAWFLQAFRRPVKHKGSPAVQVSQDVD